MFSLDVTTVHPDDQLHTKVVDQPQDLLKGLNGLVVGQSSEEHFES